MTLSVNGVEIPALLDTGSPITVFNAAAALATGITDAGASGAASGDGGGGGGGDAGGGNPFAKFASGLKAAQEGAQAAARGDVLTVAGAEGPVQLTRTQTELALSLGDASFGSDCRPFVGDLPGLAVLGGLGAAAGPAVVLGTDVLRKRPRMVYTAKRIYL